MGKRGNNPFLILGVVAGTFAVLALNAVPVALVILALVLLVWILIIVARFIDWLLPKIRPALTVGAIALVLLQPDVHEILIRDPLNWLVVAVMSFITYGVLESGKAK